MQNIGLTGIITSNIPCILNDLSPAPLLEGEGRFAWDNL